MIVGNTSGASGQAIQAHEPGHWGFGRVGQTSIADRVVGVNVGLVAVGNRTARLDIDVVAIVRAEGCSPLREILGTRRQRGLVVDCERALAVDVERVEHVHRILFVHPDGPVLGEVPRSARGDHAFLVARSPRDIGQPDAALGLADLHLRDVAAVVRDRARRFGQCVGLERVGHHPAILRIHERTVDELPVGGDRLSENPHGAEGLVQHVDRIGIARTNALRGGDAPGGQPRRAPLCHCAAPAYDDARLVLQQSLPPFRCAAAVCGDARPDLPQSVPQCRCGARACDVATWALPTRFSASWRRAFRGRPAYAARRHPVSIAPVFPCVLPPSRVTLALRAEVRGMAAKGSESCPDAGPERRRARR